MCSMSLEWDLYHHLGGNVAMILLTAPKGSWIGFADHELAEGRFVKDGPL